MDARPKKKQQRKRPPPPPAPVIEVKPKTTAVVEGEWEDEGEARKTLNHEQLKQLHTLSGIRVPMHHIASLFGMSKDTLERLAKKDDKVRAALDNGRASASSNTRSTLYFLAVGEKDPLTGKYIREPDLQALKFWCGTQEGFTTKHQIDLGLPGSAAPSEMSPEERRAEIARLHQLRQLGGGEEPL